jgi:hypothetical protein
MFMRCTPLPATFVTRRGVTGAATEARERAHSALTRRKQWPVSGLEASSPELAGNLQLCNYRLEPRGSRMTHVTAQTFGWCLFAWIGALALVVAYRILSGEISLYGLLSAEGQRFDPERVQSFFVFIFVIGAYFVQALNNDQPTKLPDIPESLLALLAGSNGLFLAGKIARAEISKGRSKKKAVPADPSALG